MTVRYQLNNKSYAGKKETPIYVAISDGRNFKEVVVPIGKKVPVTHWNPNKQQVRKSHPNAPQTNALLTRAKYEIENRFLELKLDGKVTRAAVRKLLESIFNPYQDEHQTLVLLQSYAEGKLNSSLKAGTLTNYRQLLKHLTGFQRATGKTITLESFARKDYEAFTDYLTYTAYLQDSSVAKNQQCLSAFWRWTHENEYHHNTEYLKFKKVKSVAPEPTPLYFAELQSLWNLSFTGIPEAKQNALKLSRDKYLFLCLTGQRISDLQAFKPETDTVQTPNGNRVWHCTQQKTGTRVKAPLLPEAEQLLSNWHGTFPPRSEQRTNQDLKEIGKLAGLDRLVPRTQTRSGQTTSRKVPLHTMITAHTARDTFITLFQSAGMPTYAVDAISGHSQNTVKAKHYYNPSDQDRYDTLLNSWEKIKGTNG